MIANKWSMQQYSEFLETVPEAMLVVNGAGRVVLLNAAAEGLLGYFREELAGQPVEILLPGEVWRRRAARRAGSDSQPHARPMIGGLELTAIRKDGGRLPVEISLNSLDTGTETLVVATLHDASERKRQEDERRRLDARLRQSQKLESLGVLAGGIAHDFNNLLTSILGNAGLALQALPPGSPVRGSITQVERTAERAAELVRQLLAYSGKGSCTVQEVNLSQAALETQDILGGSIPARVELRHDFHPRLPAISGDLTQIRQLIMNLITNACDAIGDGGLVTLRTGILVVDAGYLQSAQLLEEVPQGRYAYLEVLDTGAGMDESTRQRVFDPFFTTKFDGRGLGLASVLLIVRAHRGSVEIRTEAGKGTSFKVIFPCLGPEGEGAGPESEG